MACSILTATSIINNIEFSTIPQLILKQLNLRPIKPFLHEEGPSYFAQKILGLIEKRQVPFHFYNTVIK